MMKNTKLRGLLAGAGLLGMGLTTVLGSALPASAAPRTNDTPRVEQMRQGDDYRNDRWGGSNRPGRNNPRDFRTLEGIVTRDLRGDDFLLRPFNGNEVRVDVRGHEPGRLSRGDRVRVNGYFDNGVFHAQNVTIVRNR